MTLRTCTIPLDGAVSIGWSNVASNALFCQFLADRINRGYRYQIIDLSATRTVIYNYATKINNGVMAHELSMAMHEFGDFLRSGDISLVRIGPFRMSQRWAFSPQEVLDHDTIECRSH